MPANTAKDLFYVSVGFGILAFQRAQVARRELDSRRAGMERAVDAVLDHVQGRLPPPADKLMAQARSTACAARRQVRGLVVRDGA